MTSLATLSLALTVAALAGGCAVDAQTAPGNEPAATPEYRTGSNIPVRERRPASADEKARAAAPAKAPAAADPAVKPAN